MSSWRGFLLPGVTAASIAAGLMICRRADAQAGGHDAAAAEVLFRQAQRLMGQGQFEYACPKLAESQRLDPAVGTLMYLALCYEGMGKTATAWSTYLAAESTAMAAGQNDRAKAARERASALEARLSKLTISVSDAAAVDAVEVHRDDVTLGRASWGLAVPVDPGDHLITATAPGKLRWSLRVTVEPGGDMANVVVPSLEAEAAPPAPKLREAATASDQRDAPSVPAGSPAAAVGSTRQTAPNDRGNGSAQRIVGVAAGVAGIIGIGVGLAFSLRAHKKELDARHHCNIGGDAAACDRVGIEANGEALKASMTATAGFVTGVVLLGSGATLYLMAPSDKPNNEARRLEVLPAIGRNAGSFSVRGSW